MLNQIFQDYWDKVIDGDEKLIELYGTYTNTPIKWIQCEDITIRNLVNRICDDFEASGYDLNDVSIDEIRDIFIDTSVKVETPTQYIGLNEAKQYVEEQLANFNSNEAFKDHPEREIVKNNLEGALETIISKMKELM